MISWTVAYQVPLSMEFSRQEYWSGFPFPSLRGLPDPGIEPGTPALQADSLLSEPPGKLEFILTSKFCSRSPFWLCYNALGAELQSEMLLTCFSLSFSPYGVVRDTSSIYDCSDFHASTHRLHLEKMNCPIIKVCAWVEGLLYTPFFPPTSAILTYLA